MTEQEKRHIIKERKAGRGCTEIARMLGLSVNTVKSFCRRNGVPAEKEERQIPSAQIHCLHCGVLLEQHPQRKTRRFCSDSCRLAWWHAHREMEKKAFEQRCQHCGQMFHFSRERKYCSRECYFNARFGGKDHGRAAGRKAV